MTIIKLMAVVMLAGSVGITTQKSTPGIKQAQPATYSLKVAWYYNAAQGRYGLWGYTASGGGITQEILFTQTANNWASTIAGGSFFTTEFSWTWRFPRSTLNDDMFSSVGGGLYRYTSPDNTTISYYNIDGGTQSRLLVNVNDSDCFVKYKIDINKTLTPRGAGYNAVYYMGAGSDITNQTMLTPSKTTYDFAATFAMPSNVVVFPLLATGTLIDHIDAFWFEIIATANIEGDDYWDIYNQGVINGYSAGVDDGYKTGLDDGRLENTAWEDAFTIIKGAIDTVGDVMAISLFGPVTLGTLVSIPLIVGLLFWIIDKWRGS